MQTAADPAVDVRNAPTANGDDLPGLGPVQTGDFFAGQVVNLLRDETACST